MSARTVFFRGSNAPLSNLFVVKENLIYKGVTFNTTEQIYQWEKCLRHSELRLAEIIRNEKNPYKQMRIGQSFRGNIEWQNSKKDLMREILKIKFTRSQDYREALRASRGKAIVEDTCNNFWGRGKDGRGLNHLGVLHCEIRAKSKICFPVS